MEISERAKVDGNGNLRVCVKQRCAFYRQDSKAALDVFYGGRAKVHGDVNGELVSNRGDNHLRSRMVGSGGDTYFRGRRGESLHVETKISTRIGLLVAFHGSSARKGK